LINIGKYNLLRVVKKVDFGVYLDGKTDGEILMPERYVPEGTLIDDVLNVFIYLDSEDRLIATTEKPYAQVGEVAMLRVKSVDRFGAFLDWGLMKDLLVPFREQKADMIEGRSYLVYVYLDEKTNRIAASAKLSKFLNKTVPEYKEGDEVDLIIESENDLGFNAIINNLHWGMLYENEVFEQLDKGQRLKGYIKKVRSDNKIDLTLYKPGYEKIDTIAQGILDMLKQQGGSIKVTDKSEAETIYQLFGISKKTFKKAIGALYKKHLIILEPNQIRIKS
jgi:uncharacterized protein